MVSENDRSKQQEESRPPELSDLIGLAKSLNNAGVKYLIIGGIAIIQQGFVRATEDIDLLIEDSRSNLEQAIQAVGQLPDHAALEISPEEFSEFEVIRIADEIVVDMMVRASSFDYHSAKDSITVVTIQGVNIPFADASLLLKMKQGVREKDVIDRKFLELRLAELKK